MGTTLLAYRLALGRELDDLTFYPAASGTGSTVVIAELATAAANVSVNRFNGRWVFNATNGQQRRVRTGGYTASSGTLTIDPIWAVPSGSDRIELTSLFPAVEQVLISDTSYRTIINRALAQYLVQRRIVVGITAGTRQFSLAALAGWLREDRLGWPDIVMPDGTHVHQPRLLEPGPTSDSPLIPADWRKPRLRMDGTTPTLEIDAPFAAGSGGNMALNVVSPADTFISGSESSTGLVADVSEAIPSVADLMPLMLWEAIKILTARGVDSASGRWADKLPSAEAAARAVPFFDGPKIQAAPVAAGQAA